MLNEGLWKVLRTMKGAQRKSYAGTLKYEAQMGSSEEEKEMMRKNSARNMSVCLRLEPPVTYCIY